VTWTLVLDPGAFAKRKQLSGLKHRLGKSTLALLRARALARAKKSAGGNGAEYQTRVVDEFDPGWDGTWRNMLGSYGIGMFRNAEHLNWKYAHHPVLQYRIRLAERRGKMAGYLISRLARAQNGERRAVITDFLVENGDAKTLEYLLSHAINEASGADMEVLSVLTTQPWAVKVFRRFGFLRRGGSHAWVVGGWKGHVPAGWITDPERWHLCMGDSDGDLWTGSV
jgi:hypothetical protein